MRGVPLDGMHLNFTNAADAYLPGGVVDLPLEASDENPMPDGIVDQTRARQMIKSRFGTPDDVAQWARCRRKYRPIMSTEPTPLTIMF